MKWPEVKLGNLCSVVTKGTTPRTLGREYVSNGIPFLRAENLLGDEVVLSPETLFIDDPTNELLSRSVIKADDVLISIAGTIGHCAIVPQGMPTMNCNQAVAIVRISGPLDGRFLIHWLKTHDAQRQMSEAKVTLTIPNLSLGQIKTLLVPLPALSEQRRIVEILDQADMLRKKRAEADAKAARIIPALFYKMFGDPATNPKGWCVRPLGEVILDTRNGLYKPSEFYGSGVSILKMFNIQDGELDLSRVDLIDITDDEYESYRLNPGDILVNRVNTPEMVGKCAVISEEVGKAIFESKNIRMRVRSDVVTPEFVAAYLNSPFGHGSLRGGVKHAIGMATINNSDLRSTQVPLPPLDAQKKWSVAVNRLRSLVKMNAISDRKINSIFSNILYRAFSGDLTAKWREAHMKELLAEMDQQAKALR